MATCPACFGRRADGDGAAPGAAFAEIGKVTVATSADLGPFRGKAYRELHATMEGSAPGGAYAVPITLAFEEAADHNGFAVMAVNDN